MEKGGNRPLAALAEPQKNPALGRFVLFLTARPTLQGRAGVDSCRDAPAFPGETGRFTRLNDEGSGRLRRMAASICRHQLALSRFQLAPTVSRLT
jgi:hypothetical protein